MTKFVAMYLRVSTFDQAHNGYGLGDQEVQCRKYIDLYFPEDEIKVYKDDGYSAKNLSRPEMKRMLDDVYKRKIHTIVAFKLDRLTRSVIDTYKLIKTVMEYDCSLVAVVDRIDISSANGRMLVGILSVISQWEREVISERTVAGLEQMVRSGKYPYGGRDPFGWTRDKNVLKIVPEEADIIKDMTQKYVYEGYGIDDLRIYLEKTYGMKKKWYFIRNCLINKRNIGIFEYHGVEYRDVVPAIMDEDLYYKAVEKATHRNVSQPNQEMYLFHGLVHCKCGKRCDHVSTVKTKNKYRHTYYYYWCPKCNKRVNQDKLFNQIVIPLGLHINSNKTSEQLKKLEDDLLFFKDRRLQILDDYINGNIDVTTYDLSIKKVKKMIFDIGKKIKEFDESGIRQLIYADRVTKRKLIQTHISYIMYDFELGDVTNIVYKTKK